MRDEKEREGRGDRWWEMNEGKMLSLWWKQKEESEDRVRRGRVSSEDRNKRDNSHVKAQVLLLLKEVVQDVLSDKVWV